MRLRKGRWVGEPKPPDFSRVAPVTIYDAVGRVVEIVSAEAWRQRRGALPSGRGRLRQRVAGRSGRVTVI